MRSGSSAEAETRLDSLIKSLQKGPAASAASGPAASSSLSSGLSSDLESNPQPSGSTGSGPTTTLTTFKPRVAAAASTAARGDDGSGAHTDSLFPGDPNYADFFFRCSLNEQCNNSEHFIDTPAAAA